MWKRAKEEEIWTLLEAGTWERVPQPSDQNVIASKWVLQIKMKAGGIINKYKAQLVAQGFMQFEGVDYFVTFAPVAKFASLQIILAIAARNNWEIRI